MDDQPSPTGGTGDCWQELIDALPAHPLRQEMIARRTLGIERYGQPLRRGDGRDEARDLREELIDAAVYAQRLYGAPVTACQLSVEMLAIATDPASWMREREEQTDRDLDQAFRVAEVLARAGIGPAPLPDRVAELAARATLTPREHHIAQAVVRAVEDSDASEFAPVIRALLGVS